VDLKPGGTPTAALKKDSLLKKLEGGLSNKRKPKGERIEGGDERRGPFKHKRGGVEKGEGYRIKTGGSRREGLGQTSNI